MPAQPSERTAETQAPVANVRAKAASPAVPVARSAARSATEHVVDKTSRACSARRSARSAAAADHLRTGSPCRDHIGLLKRAARRGNQPRPAQDGRGHDHARVLGIDANRPLARGRRRVRPSPGHRRRGPGRAAADGRLLGHRADSLQRRPVLPVRWPGRSPQPGQRPVRGGAGRQGGTPTSPTGSPRSPPRPSRPPSTRPPTSSTGS